MVLRSVVRWLRRNGVAPYGALGDPKAAAVYLYAESVTAAVVSLLFFALSALHVREGRHWYSFALVVSGAFSATFAYAAVAWGRRGARFTTLERRHSGARMSIAREASDGSGGSVDRAVPLRSALLVVLAVACTSQLGAAVHTHHAKLPLQLVSLALAIGAMLLSLEWCVRQWAFARVAMSASVAFAIFGAPPNDRGRFTLRIDGLAPGEREVRDAWLCDDRGAVLAACRVHEQRVDAEGVCTVVIDVLRAPSSSSVPPVAPTMLSLIVAPGVTLQLRYPSDFELRT